MLSYMCNCPRRFTIAIICYLKKIARGIPSCIWDVKQNGHSDSADLIGGKTPDRALWNARIHAKLHVQIQITSGSVLFLPLSFFILGKYNLI